MSDPGLLSGLMSFCFGVAETVWRTMADELKNSVHDQYEWEAFQD